MLDFVHPERSALRPARADDFSPNRHPALSFCLSMIFSENRCPLFRIMLWKDRPNRPLLNGSNPGVHAV